MTVRACICIGVADYDDIRLHSLPGARLDAERTFEALINPSIGKYDRNASRLLLNPEKAQVLDEVAELVYRNDIDTFAFYFAGHGGSRNEAYGLCCSNSDFDRFAYTALMMGDIFRIINDARPRHSNLVIDACNAAGMLSDLHNLLKSSFLGQAGSSSVSILAMSASDRSAAEDDHGGIGTTAFLQCLNGKLKVPVLKEYLSLEDIGAAIAPKLKDQAPNFWSFNASGVSRFVVNPHFDQSDVRSALVAPYFDVLKSELLSAQHLDMIWKEYVAIAEGVDPRRLQNRLQSVLRDVGESERQASLLLGLAESYSSRASESADGFSVVEVLCSVLFAAEEISVESVRSSVQEYLLAQLDEALVEAISQLASCLGEEYGLVSKGPPFSEFFGLPVRISKVSAWCLCSAYLATDNTSLQALRIGIARDILDSLTHQYETSFSLVSERQAAYIHVISALGAEFALSDWSESYISTLYADYFLSERRVAKVGLPEVDVFDFLKFRSGRAIENPDKFVARPSELLLVLLYHFVSSGRSEIVRYDFCDLDGVHFNTFVPDSYANFSREVVSNGTNIGCTIGFDVFTVSEFERLLHTSVLPRVSGATKGISRQDAAIALIASLIYPDRIAWFLSVESRRGLLI